MRVGRLSVATEAGVKEATLSLQSGHGTQRAARKKMHFLEP